MKENKISRFLCYRYKILQIIFTKLDERYPYSPIFSLVQTQNLLAINNALDQKTNVSLAVESGVLFLHGSRGRFDQWENCHTC